MSYVKDDIKDSRYYDKILLGYWELCVPKKTFRLK